MKHSLLTSLILALVLFLTSCSTTRKATQSSFEQTVREQTSTNSQNETEKSEALLTQTNTQEELNAEITFTRIEFNDGTTLDSILPPIRADTPKQRDREATEPPDIPYNHGGVKAITFGNINLNKSSEGNTTTAETADYKSTSTEEAISETDVTTVENEKNVEKERRGFFYYFGVIIGAVIAITLIIYVIRLITSRTAIKK